MVLLPEQKPGYARAAHFLMQRRPRRRRVGGARHGRRWGKPAFPNAFFADPGQVQPLKVNIHHDLAAVRPEGVTPFQVGRFLFWCVNRPAYQRALTQEPVSSCGGC